MGIFEAEQSIGTSVLILKCLIKQIDILDLFGSSRFNLVEKSAHEFTNLGQLPIPVSRYSRHHLHIELSAIVGEPCKDATSPCVADTRPKLGGLS